MIMKDLVIVNSMFELGMLDKLCEREYIIGTLNTEFYLSMCKGKTAIYFLEPEESVPYEGVKEVIKKINNSITEVCSERKELYDVSYHLESGLQQSIAQDCLYIDYFLKFVKHHRIEKILTIDNVENWIINEVLFLLSRERLVEIRIFNTDGAEKECLYTLRNSTFDRNRNYKDIDKEGYKVIWEKLKRKVNINDEINANKECNISHLGFLYAVKNNQKHYGWLIDGLEKYDKNLSKKIICFYVSDDVERIREQGYDVDCVENYFSKYEYVKDVYSFLYTRKKIRKQLKKNLYIEYHGIDLTGWFDKKYNNYLNREVLEHIYIYSCMKRYFKKNKFHLICSWGTSNFWQTRIVSKCIGTDTKIFREEEISVITHPYYEPFMELIEIRFFPNKEMEKDYQLAGFKGNGQVLMDLNIGRRYYAQKEVKRFFMNKEATILVALSYPVVGIRTLKNYYQICRYIFDSIHEKIIFKNHPNIDKSLDNDIRELAAKYENIKFIDKGVSIDSLISGCDLVITDASTIIFDTIIEQKPLFCIMGCQDYEIARKNLPGLKIYRDIMEMCNRINAILKNEKEIHSLLEEQNLFMTNLIGNEEIDTIEKMNCFLRKEIKDEKNYSLYTE